MKAIVAVYDDWGIGANGTQPVVLSADRTFFREMTRGACVVVGRRTLADFPGGRPLPNRENRVLTRDKNRTIPGAVLCGSPEEAAENAPENTFVIGGGSVYAQMLPYCREAIVTKVYTAPVSDTFFPNLDTDPGWTAAETLQRGEENGIAYEMVRYVRK